MTAETTTRRTVLTTGVAAAGVAAGAVALAACGSSDSGSGTNYGSASASSSSATSATGTKVAALSDISVGEAKTVTINGEQAIVARPSETSAVAFSARCTHQGCTVVPKGATLNCPCHGSVFNALTGAVVKDPARSPLKSIPVKVDNGTIVTA